MRMRLKVMRSVVGVWLFVCWMFCSWYSHVVLPAALDWTIAILGIVAMAGISFVVFAELGIAERKKRQRGS